MRANPIGWISILGVAVGAVIFCCDVRRSDAADADATAILEEFAKAWPDNRTPYRTEGDSSWTAYPLAISKLVSLGDEAVPGLIAGAKDARAQVRGLCARVLGLLSAKSAAPQLIELLDDDSNMVALLAADSLGQIQDPEGLKALAAARSRIENGDVLLHISKALERKTPLEEEVLTQIAQLNPETIDSAEVGQLAPEFSIQDSDGRAWKLADFRGKKSVVLVFIYGDG